MINFKIRETEDYEKLVPFFIENELEFTEEDAEEVPTDVIKCWEITEGTGQIPTHKPDGEVSGQALAQQKRTPERPFFVAALLPVRSAIADRHATKLIQPLR